MLVAAVLCLVILAVVVLPVFASPPVKYYQTTEWVCVFNQNDEFLAVLPPGSYITDAMIGYLRVVRDMTLLPDNPCEE
jgi:hypothetical protein